MSGGGAWCCINNALSLNARPCFAASRFVPVFTPRPRIRHAPQPRGRAPSDTQRQIFKWRSLILTIQRPFVTRRLNKDEMEFLCHVTNRGKGSGNKHENMRSISDRMGKCLSESATFSCLSKRFRSCQALSSWTHTNEEYSVYNWFE